MDALILSDGLLNACLTLKNAGFAFLLKKETGISESMNCFRIHVRTTNKQGRDVYFQIIHALLPSKNESIFIGKNKCFGDLYNKPDNDIFSIVLRIKQLCGA